MKKCLSVLLSAVMAASLLGRMRISGSETDVTGCRRIHCGRQYNGGSGTSSGEGGDGTG